MWFIFPQAEGLGTSEIAQQYAIRSRVEADAYISHPVLGLRLLECTEAALTHKHKPALDLFARPMT